MRKYILILFLLLNTVIHGQIFSTYYNENGITGRINVYNKIIDYKYRDQKRLDFNNNTDVACTITGYVKIRYVEFYSGKEYFTEKNFKLNLQPGRSSWVNCYYNPSSKVGMYEPISFYVEGVYFAQNNYQSSSYTSSSVGSKSYFTEKTIFFGENSESKQTAVYNTDGTCSAMGYILTEGHWEKGTSNGVYYIEGNVIYATWDDWLKETYMINNNTYSNYGLIMRKK